MATLPTGQIPSVKSVFYERSLSSPAFEKINLTTWGFFLDDVFVLCYHWSIGQFCQIVPIVKGLMCYVEKDPLLAFAGGIAVAHASANGYSGRGGKLHHGGLECPAE